LLISQSGTSAPTLVVGRNTLGGIPTPSYTGVGDFALTLTGAFPGGGKTKVLVTQFPASDTGSISAGRANDNTIQIRTRDITAAGALANGLLNSVTMIIKVDR
jgi:hypothetical protein